MKISRSSLQNQWVGHGISIPILMEGRPVNTCFLCVEYRFDPIAPPDPFR
jgi:hypothetical protein